MNCNFYPVTRIVHWRQPSYSCNATFMRYTYVTAMKSQQKIRVKSNFDFQLIDHSHSDTGLLQHPVSECE